MFVCNNINSILSYYVYMESKQKYFFNLYLSVFTFLIRIFGGKKSTRTVCTKLFLLLIRQNRKLKGDKVKAEEVNFVRNLSSRCF